MTTPEQLAKWREDAYTSLKNEPDNWGINGGGYERGYLRRCQETEQAIKDARKQALEEAAAKFSGLDIYYTLTAGNITNMIKGLLK